MILKKLYDIYAEKRMRRIQAYRSEFGIDAIISHENAIKDIYIPASILHQKVFPKYKGINKGKTVVLVGTAPTLDYYTPIENAVHMGVNQAFKRDDIQLDYLFRCDRAVNSEVEEMTRQYKGKKCKKFYGYQYRFRYPIPEYLRDNPDVESFYCLSYDYGKYGHNLDKDRFFFFPPDISISPFKSYGTTMFIVLQFALWTHPDKIYLVGCDCSSGHASTADDNSGSSYSYLIEPWKKAKEFTEDFYPDVEIVSINPVGLKGLFKDVYTEEYLNSKK